MYENHSRGKDDNGVDKEVKTKTCDLDLKLAWFDYQLCTSSH